MAADPRAAGDRDPLAVAREVCLSFPDTEEVPSRGSPDFRVRGKTFATLLVNHHGDGRCALWLDAPPGAQQLYTENEPEHYFVPPYVGPKGWLGVHLDRGLSWPGISRRVWEAWRHRAPEALARTVAEPPTVAPPDRPLDPFLLAPFDRPRSAAVLAAVRDICLGLPETSEDRQFGDPCFRAGKKTFCVLGHRRGRLYLQAWVGIERQGPLAEDPRYRVPAYIGHRGWIDLDVEEHLPEDEAVALIEDSYRHFALKRMLKALDGSA